MIWIAQVVSAAHAPVYADLGDLSSAQDLVGDILRSLGLECSRHG